MLQLEEMWDKEEIFMNKLWKIREDLNLEMVFR